ncbi:hypothetical protein ILUMI_13759 [Ignelater luminosus]|uniref:HTH psq-type domain-containing protein n=1 Tax=Ignelater luminosus TaxID=2038154 RepID=A0A8K0CX67_IGNLU|nr:hypothetical protein ILUMI_13759 [Ignelater luminosus]
MEEHRAKNSKISWLRKPRIDTCSTCDSIDIRLKAGDISAKVQQELHHRRTKAATKAMPNDTQSAKISDTYVISFDLRQHNSWPNLGIHDSKKRGFMCLRRENFREKGSLEISCCIYHYLTTEADIESMPRSKLGVKRPPINKNAFEAAVADVLQNNLSFRKAARVHNVSRATLMRHVKKYKDSNKENFEYNVSYIIHKVFSKEEESLLVSYLKQAARLHYGLKLSEVRILAYQYAKANNKKYSDKWETNKKAEKS